jgi:FkbM family methyltransferase
MRGTSREKSRWPQWARYAKYRFDWYARYFQALGVRDGLAALFRVRVLPKIGAGPIGLHLRRAGIRLRFPGDESSIDAFEKIFVQGHYDFPEAMGAATVVDLGAHVGLSAARFATLSPGARIIAIEPSKRNLEWLVGNSAAFPGIALLRAAIGPNPWRLQIENPEDRNDSFRWVEGSDPERESVESMTLDDLFRRFDLDRIDLLKVDIEGAEIALFGEGDVGWLAKVRTIVIEMHGPAAGEVVRRRLPATEWDERAIGENTVFSRRDRPRRMPVVGGDSPRIVGAIPCLNGEATLARAVASMRAQTVGVDRLIVVDDGSSDRSAEIAGNLGAEVIRLGSNLGRGAARAVAMEAAGDGVVLFCDATCELAADFAEKGMTWFGEDRVAAVCAPFAQGLARNAVERWRGRHLLKAGAAGNAVRRGAPFFTGGCLLRGSAVSSVGGFDRTLFEREDADLGKRLLRQGFDVICDPGLMVRSVKGDSVRSVLERYARWNTERPISAWEYARLVWFSVKVMAARDVRAGDFRSAAISLICPHYQMWRSRRVKRCPGSGAGGSI